MTEVLGNPHDDLPCQSWDPNLWFSESPQDIALAKAICQTCPVRLLCLDIALARQEAAGIWGGEIFLDGQIVSHRRPRGRPRKNSPWSAAPSVVPVESVRGRLTALVPECC